MWIEMLMAKIDLVVVPLAEVAAIERITIEEMIY